jgi:hypothetical protein
MAHASASVVPLSISLRRAIKAGLARERENLEDFESGRRRMGERSEDGPWRDVTTQWIHNQKRIIETFESVLAALEREEAR